MEQSLKSRAVIRDGSATAPPFHDARNVDNQYQQSRRASAVHCRRSLPLHIAPFTRHGTTLYNTLPGGPFSPIEPTPASLVPGQFAQLVTE